VRLRLLALVLLSFRLAATQGPEGTATVRGRVVDAVTGRPLRNLFINFYPQPRMPYTPGIDAEPPKRSAITGDDGAFEVSKLIAAEYGISAGAPADYLSIEYGTTRPGGPSRHLTVADNAQMDITIRAWRAATIAGHVYDERGRPVIGADVRVFEKDSEVHAFSVTDDRGAYEIARLQPGLYTVAVPVSLWNHTLSSAPVRSAPSGSPTPYVVDRGLRTMMTVQGVPPAPSTEEGQPQVYVTTFAGGASTRDAAAFTRLESGDYRDNLDITLPAVRGTRVSGIVTAAADITGTVLTLMPEAALRSFDVSRITATVAADGRFVFAATPPGKYVLSGYRHFPPPTEVSLAGGNPLFFAGDEVVRDPDEMWIEMPLAVGDADIDNLVVTLSPGTPITGRIVVDDDRPGEDPPAGIRVGQATIRLFLGPNRMDDRYIPVEADGSISTRLRPGVYHLLAFADRQDRAFKTTIVHGQEIGYGPLVVGTEPLRDVQFVFARFDTLLQGSVAEADGNPAPDATVIAIPADRDTWLRLEESGRARIARANNGSYRLTGIAPGDYYVIALHFFLGTPSARDAASLAAIATRVTVRPGQPALVNLVARDRE